MAGWGWSLEGCESLGGLRSRNVRYTRFKGMGPIGPNFRLPYWSSPHELERMSQLLIQQYLNQLSILRKVSGTHRETVVREAFKDLLKNWGRSYDLVFIPEYELDTKGKERRYVDGALLHTLRVPFGYWEAKDEKDDLDAEIDVKFRRGYPKTNIIFEDSTQAVLIQHGEEVMRCGVEDVGQLEALLKIFFAYERPEIEAFRRAVEQFQADLPSVLGALRSMIEEAHNNQARFRQSASAFLTHAKDAINPSLTEADVREMLIQHILTGEIFGAVFPDTSFHEDNNIAVELNKLEDTFFTGNTKFKTLKGLEPYYSAIRRAASEISTHYEKQNFLKAIYENFYKVYNPKAADRLGVVYTPTELVRFMIESTEWLCEQHFKRNLIDKNVDILDPATGTGTFICELIAHFAGQPEKLAYKYQRELHANEVAILPYYVANLNIEATFSAVVDRYEEFPGLCFVDTLDNTYALRKHRGHIDDLFGSVTDDNIKRIQEQNSKTISIIIGNPPYNANQLNENDNNKNREYLEIDKRISGTYIEASTAQKTKLYDMYVRFFRWASDRLDENGIIAFVSNNSFIDSRGFDGFRKCLAREFNEIRVIDLKGDARTSGEQRRKEGGNVFADQIRVGIAVWFCVRKKGVKGCRILYEAVRDYAKADEKREFLVTTALRDRTFIQITPQLDGAWINVSENDFESLMPIATKEAKAAKRSAEEKAIFKLFSLGVVTNRDEWVYDEDESDLTQKVKWLIDTYNADRVKLEKVRDNSELAEMLDTSIKWTRAVKKDLRNGIQYRFDPKLIVKSNYRPFVSRLMYFSRELNEVQYRLPRVFGETGTGKVPTIVFTDPTAQKPFMVLGVDGVFDLHLVGAAAGSVGVPFKLAPNQDRSEPDNITDWALARFRKQYKSDRRKEGLITKEGIFHYVYGVLHNPFYREKYAMNLKRQLPRIPFYKDFWIWADWGRRLLELHIDYTSARPYPLKRSDTPDTKARSAGLSPKALLKADKSTGRIQLDSETELTGVPLEAWGYRLGNASALEWVLDQYRETTPKDRTIREKFNSYRFKDYKERVIDLLARCTTVSVETMKIIEEMNRRAEGGNEETA